LGKKGPNWNSWLRPGEKIRARPFINYSLELGLLIGLNSALLRQFFKLPYLGIPSRLFRKNKLKRRIFGLILGIPFNHKIFCSFNFSSLP